jgi:signal transduction histidine kinase
MYKDPATDLFLKTEQLLYFRLTFALVSLFFSILVGLYAPGEFDQFSVSVIIAVVVAYTVAAVYLLRSGKFREDKRLNLINSVLLTLDVVALTGLVHFTKGIESDIYFLYLLPILLASHVFGRRGIFMTAGLVSVLYVSLLLTENISFIPYLIDSSQRNGLAAAYTQRLWVRIFSRSAIIVCISFAWGAFCEHMSAVAEQGANRLREQLAANNRLVTETRAQASREHLINSISSAIRSTLDLDEILKTTVSELRAALNASRCAIIEPPVNGDDDPPIWETVNPAYTAGSEQKFTPELCRFIIKNKAGAVQKDFVYDEPIRDWSFREVRDDLSKLEFRALIVQPIIYAGETSGVMLIGECEQRRTWTAYELELVKAVAGQVAIAIEHARLVDRLVQKNEHLDAKNLELRTVQSQMIHHEKMASLGRLVAGIAHELNNPINFVHGNLPYLRQYFADIKQMIEGLSELPDEYKAKLDEQKKRLKYDFVITDLDNIIADLEEGADRIRYIIRNLRSFSRLDHADLKEANIREGIESTLKILNQYYGRDKIPVEISFADMPSILCYPGQLNQVWMNLLSNAAQALGSVEEPKVTIHGDVIENCVVVSVADNGPGIKQQDQSKIFEPFFTTKPVGQGTGLGLSICHSIMERHGGQIWFESVAGAGTTFKVRIPLRAQPAEPVMVAEEV